LLGYTKKSQAHREKSVLVVEKSLRKNNTTTADENELKSS